MAANDPFTQFRFRVLWDEQFIRGISKVTGLKRTTVVVSHREGGDSATVRKSPGETTYEPIMIERDRIPDLAFEAWADQVVNQPEPGGFRKEVFIEVLDESDQPVLRYQVHRCWPSEYVALGDLTANTNGIAIEALRLEHEGWTRIA